MSAQHRTFDSGATRNLDRNKLDYEAFLCPLVLRRYAQYMHANRLLPDGTLRAGDNWQQGIPIESYMKSLTRHHIEAWMAHRGYPADDIQTSLCALIFNASGYLHELLKDSLRTASAKPSDAAPGTIDAEVEALLPPNTEAGEE